MELTQTGVDRERESIAAVERSPWRTMKQGAARLGGRVSERALKRAAAAGRLKAIRINGRGDLRTTDRWIDDWLLSLQK